MKNLIVTVNGVAYNVTVEEGTGAAVASAPVAAAPAAVGAYEGHARLHHSAVRSAAPPAEARA